MTTPLSTGRSMGRNSLVLGLFAIFTVGLIALTYQSTEERITEQRQRMQMRALTDILPADQHDNDLLEDAFTIDDRRHLQLPAPAQAWRGQMNGQVVAVILPVTTTAGYSGRIDLLVGIRAAGELAGVRVLDHRETPGLGDKLELGKDDWILDFNGKSLSMPAPPGWAVRKDGGDFDQFTGATITPRAVVQAVYRALEYFHIHRDSLLELPAQEPADGQHPIH